MGADRLLTLTKRDGISTLDECWQLWGAFERLVKRRWPNSAFNYVVVPEQHQNGTWHLHVAVRGFWNVISMRSLWHRVLTGGKRDITLYGPDAPGNVDITDPSRYRRRHSNLSASCANYIAAYVGKGLASVELGRRTFASAKGIAPLESRVLHLTFEPGADELLNIVETYISAWSGLPEWHFVDYGQGKITGGYGEAGIRVSSDEFRWSRT